MPRRYRVLLWAVPLFFLQWIALALIEPEGGPGWIEYVSIGFFFGTFFGQTTLAAAWAALGPGPFRWRLPLSLVWVTMLPVASPSTSASMAVPKLSRSLRYRWLSVRSVADCADSRCGAGDGVRLTTAACGRWGGTHDHRERQFGIRHLMIFTAIVGVLFGVGRSLMIWLGESLQVDSDDARSSFSWLSRRSR